MTRGVLGVLIMLGGALALLLVPGVGQAHEGEMHATVTAAREHLRQNASSTVDATCMAGAVETRETALITAWSDLNSTIAGALGERKTALVAAWNMSSASERSAALRNAWKEWKADKKSAHTEFRKDRKAAWDAFKKTAKDSCKVTVPKDDAMEKSEKDTVAI